MSGEITFIGGGYLRTASQYTTGSPPRLVGDVLNTLLPRSGALRIAGTVKRDATLQIPSARRVILTERDSLRVVRGHYSNADGSYAFEKIDAYPANYIVKAIDQTGQYNADIVDNIQPSNSDIHLVLTKIQNTIYPISSLVTQFPYAP